MGAPVQPAQQRRPRAYTWTARNEPALIEVPVGDLPDPWRFIDMAKVRGG